MTRSNSASAPATAWTTTIWTGARWRSPDATGGALSHCAPITHSHTLAASNVSHRPTGFDQDRAVDYRDRVWRATSGMSGYLMILLAVGRAPAEESTC
jgi:hypothetical protein